MTGMMLQCRIAGKLIYVSGWNVKSYTQPTVVQGM